MNQIKGSIVVLAVAAAFAGSAAAQVTNDQCKDLIGFNTFVANYTGVLNTGAGAWASVANNAASFISNRAVTCTVPKNKKETYRLGSMNSDECGAFAALASADGKVSTNKLFDAQSTLAALQSKLATLLQFGKLQQTGYDAISKAVGDAQTCVNLLITQGP